MLDPKGRDEVMETMMLLNKGIHMTVVLITHFMEEAIMADRVCVLSDGKLALSGSPASVFSEEETLQKLGLTLPPAAAIAQGLRKEGYPIPTCGFLFRRRYSPVHQDPAFRSFSFLPRRLFLLCSWFPPVSDGKFCLTLFTNELYLRHGILIRFHRQVFPIWPKRRWENGLKYPDSNDVHPANNKDRS
jgi:hypothetical protein